MRGLGLPSGLQWQFGGGKEADDWGQQRVQNGQRKELATDMPLPLEHRPRPLP